MCRVKGVNRENQRDGAGEESEQWAGRRQLEAVRRQTSLY